MRSRFVGPGVLVALGVALIVADGCSSSPSRPGPAGSLGGAGGTSGDSATGGTSGSAGSSGTAGSRGTGGSGTGGSGGMAGGATGGTGGSSGAGGSGGTGTGGSGGTGTGGSGGTGGIFDAGPPPGCDPMLGLTTQKLTANQNTPQGFRDAYNAEVQNGQGSAPGPLLVMIQFSSSTIWFGPPQSVSGGYGFGTPHDSAPFKLTSSIQIATTPSSFALVVGGATIPVVYVEGNGTPHNDCKGVDFNFLSLAIPESAGSISFHGSTVANLMGQPGYIGPLVDGGPPTDPPDADPCIPDGGPPPDATFVDAAPPDANCLPPTLGWHLELSGTATYVSYQGGTP